jgi:general secretion pathway protein H
VRERHARERGFTLLELLVVVAIIAVFVGAVVLQVGIASGADHETEREVARLKSLVDLAHEEALLQTRDFGVFFTRSAYRFYVYDHGLQKWNLPLDDRLLTEHAIDERLQLRLALVVEDRELVLPETFATEDDEEPEPQVLVLSSGEITPFEARVFVDPAVGEHVLTAELTGATEISTRGYGTP